MLGLLNRYTYKEREGGEASHYPSDQIRRRQEKVAKAFSYHIPLNISVSPANTLWTTTNATTKNGNKDVSGMINL